MLPLIGAALAYLLGSIPSAFLAGKWVRGIDLREHGSGNLGATNALRVLGWKIGVPVLLIDIAKGAIPAAYFSQWFAPAEVAHADWYAIGYGVCAIIGHVRPIFLLWKGGGKGVATAAGVFLALTPLPTLAAIGIFVVVLFVSGYVSLGSLTSAVALPVLVALRYGMQSPKLWLALLVALFVFWTHRANISRLRRGEEHRFGRKKKKNDDESSRERRADSRADARAGEPS
ncbi:MAG: glycerol-3-phosphate 1-O-acyltransferase PlsY [Gemmatimonadaceae bacterium]